ncbi:MAG: hypothetical protein P4M11_06720 [Candidatus Pacebacteria bacterium]|nr:hypothetical protein [Candidatus Paceibacterota bacterium]
MITSRIIVLKYGRRPPIYGTQLNTKAFKILPLALCYHMLYALFAYTSPQIYPLSVYNDVDDGITIYEGKSLSLLDRITCRLGLPFLVGALLVLSMVIFRKLIKRAILKMCPNLADCPHVNSEILFSCAKERMQYNHVMTYNIMANPEYAYIVQEVENNIGK